MLSPANALVRLWHSKNVLSFSHPIVPVTPGKLLIVEAPPRMGPPIQAKLWICPMAQAELSSVFDIYAALATIDSPIAILSTSWVAVIHRGSLVRPSGLSSQTLP